MYALEINNLKKKYANGTFALKGIDLKVKQKDFFALLGPNGAGKTTAIGIITSLVNKSEGQIKIFGIDTDKDFLKAKSQIGVVPQEFNFNMFEKVIDIVLNQAGFYGISRKQALPRAEFYLKKLDLWDKRNSTSRTLSGGMKRRLMIARALVHDPKMLILDEPTAGIDIELRRSTWKFLQELNRNGTTIILTTHYLEEAEYLCNGIAIIDRGVIVEQTTIKQLIKRMHKEIFILDLSEPIVKLPEVPECEVTAVDPSCLEISIPSGLALNTIFNCLSEQGIMVRSLRNKANRLEELFLNLVESREQLS